MFARSCLIYQLNTIVRNFFDVAHSNDYYVADITEYEYPNALLDIGIIFFRKIEIIRHYMLDLEALINSL